MTASSLVFLDTNVLVYAYDADAGGKRARAGAIIDELWRAGSGIVSTQVLQEFYVTLTRKLPRPLDHERAIQLVMDFGRWSVHTNTPDDIASGAEIAARNRLSFWDGLIINAARRGGASRILSEDLQAGRRIEGVLIENPFLA